MNHIILELSQITDYIFIGTNACCTTHFNEELLSLGIEADISLEAKLIDQPFGVEFYLWLPTEDHQAPTQEQLKIGVRVLENLIEMKKKVYVHCEKGHGRAPTLVAAYLMTQGMKIGEAIEFLKSKRSKVHLQPSQLKALKDFKGKVTKSGLSRNVLDSEKIYGKNANYNKSGM